MRSQKTSCFVKSVLFTPPLETWWLHLNRINTAGSEATVMLMWDDWLVQVQCASVAPTPEQMLWCKADARRDSQGPRANGVQKTSFINTPAGRSMHEPPILPHSDREEMCTNKWVYFDIILRQKPFRRQRPDTGKMLSRVRWISSPSSSYNLKQTAASRALTHRLCRKRGRNFAEICTSCWQERCRHTLLTTH